MKKILTVIIMLMMGPIVFAQTSFNNSLQFSVGGGLSHCSFGHDIRTAPAGSFTAELGYARTFAHGVGVGVGLKVMNFGYSATFSKSIQTQGLPDEEGELYDLSTQYIDVLEKHNTWMLAVPVSLQYQHMFTEKLGIFASAGVSLLFPMSAQFRTLSGIKTTEAYYPEWNVTLHDIDDYYETQDIVANSGKEEACKKFGLSVDMQADFVFLITQNVNLTAGVAYSQNILNLVSDKPASSLLVNCLEQRKALPYGVYLKVGVAYSF